MNIKIITRHAPSNYGSLLQSFATLNILKRMGHDAMIIDYIRADDLGLKKVWTEAGLKGGSFLKKLVYTLIRFPIEKIAEFRFEKMRNRLLKKTQRYSSIDDLKKIQADVFMTGSDQVWGPMVNGEYDSAYFLTFVGKGKKVAYAASFGKTKMDKNTENSYKQMLEAYDEISVREDSAASLIEQWGCKKCIGQVIDPTLLLSGDEWKNQFAIKENAKDSYVLIYQIHNNLNLSKYAKNLATRKKMKLVRVNPFLHQCLRGGKFHLCPDVKDFLSLINNATYIVTDSFHGTCFAVNFNKQFVEILPNNTTRTRNQSILRLTGLTSRIVENYSDISLVDNIIDYVPVNTILASERSRCLNIMSDLLK
ncbi:MAG: polysaccharide pyruvyl transferase family protein [Candidatus Omnitrophota bacterium]|jgi:hypothetical protein